VEERGSPTPRHHVYRCLCGLLRACSAAQRDATLGELTRQAEGVQGSRATHRTLESADVLRLAEGGLIHVGAHTVSHPTLAALTPAEQQDEIQGGKARLEAITDGRVLGFAYPFGTPVDYTSTTVELVRRAGFHYALSAMPGRVDSASDFFRLPRVIVRNWSADGLARRLAAWV
jgi:peptidoglycan/xylan/chitin deacetylase (PgdA/CDA1 family)